MYTFKNYQKKEIIRNHLNMGGENARGERIDVTNLYFERGGKPWIGIMGGNPLLQIEKRRMV